MNIMADRDRKQKSACVQGPPTQVPKIPAYKSPLWDTSKSQCAAKIKRPLKPRNEQLPATNVVLSGITPLTPKKRKASVLNDTSPIGKSVVSQSDSDSTGRIADRLRKKLKISNSKVLPEKGAGLTDQVKRFTLKGWKKATSENDSRTASSATDTEQLESVVQSLLSDCEATPSTSASASSNISKKRTKLKATSTPLVNQSASKNKKKTKFQIFEQLTKKFCKSKLSEKRMRSPMVQGSVSGNDSAPVGNRKKRRIDQNDSPLPGRVVGSPFASTPVNKKQSGKKKKFKKARRRCRLWDQHFRNRIDLNIANQSIIDLTCEPGSASSPWETNVTNYNPQVELDAGRIPGFGITMTVLNDSERSVHVHRNTRKFVSGHVSNYVSMPSIVIDDDSCLSSEEVASDVPARVKRAATFCDPAASIVIIDSPDVLDNLPIYPASRPCRSNATPEATIVREILTLDETIDLLSSPKIPSPIKHIPSPSKSVLSPWKPEDKSVTIVKETCVAPRESHNEDDSLIILEEHLVDKVVAKVVQPLTCPSPSKSPDIMVLCQKKKVFCATPPVINNESQRILHPSSQIPTISRSLFGNPNISINLPLLGNPLMPVQPWQPSANSQLIPWKTQAQKPNYTTSSQVSSNYAALSNAPFTSMTQGYNYSTPPRVAEVGLRPIIIDGSNVAMGHGSENKFSSRGLKICVDFFLKKNHKVYAFVPLFRRSDPDTLDPKILDKLEKSKHLIYTPSRYIDGRRITPYDDRYIVQMAADLGGVIVSKDNYRDLLRENSNYHDVIKNRLLMFTWVEDIIIFPPDPLGQFGPPLERFLRF